MRKELIETSEWSQLILSSSSLLTCSAMALFRNLSSADMGRQTMRNYPGLIDSVMTYAQNCVASNRPDDKVPAAPPRLFAWVQPRSYSLQLSEYLQTPFKQAWEGTGFFVAAFDQPNPSAICHSIANLLCSWPKVDVCFTISLYQTQSHSKIIWLPSPQNAPLPHLPTQDPSSI